MYTMATDINRIYLIVVKIRFKEIVKTRNLVRNMCCVCVLASDCKHVNSGLGL